MPDLLQYFAAMDDLESVRRAGYCTDEWSRWQQGQCGTYAHALTRMNHGLHFGTAGTEEFPESHFFAHDQAHAYDSAGRHPLPYRGIHGDLTENDLHADAEDYGLPEDEAGPEDPEENVAAAMAHARRNGILEGRYQRRTSHEAARDQISYRHLKHPDGTHEIQARHGDRQVGHLVWNHRGDTIDEGAGPGEIFDIEVHPDYRRRGIGTEMHDRALRHDPDAHISPDRTQAGDDFAQALGYEPGIIHEAARRIPRGHSLCGCCNGTGEHSSGKECYRCDASGSVSPQEEREPYCDGSENRPPRRRHWRQRTALGDFPGPDAEDPDEPLPVRRGLWYRVHRKDQPFSPGQARSRSMLWGEPGHGDAAGLRGYSAFASPHHLDQYLHHLDWHTHGDLPDRKVISFHGKEVGRGIDKEPLVIPEPDHACCGRMIHDQMHMGIFDMRLESTSPPRRDLNIADIHHQAARRVSILHGEDELPPDPGTVPIPEGHVRLWHYTPERNIASIREHGLLRSHARGDSGTGDLSEPSAGVWASTKRPDDILDDHSAGRAAVVEYHAHPDEISGNAESPWQAQRKDRTWDPDRLRDWAGGYHHVIMHGDVKPSQILAIHEGWHGAARYMRDDDPSLQSYQWVKDEANEPWNDHLEPYRRGLRALEKRGAVRHPGMRNPYTGSDEWYHGTRAFPEELSQHHFADPAGMHPDAYSSPESESTGHWNALLGTHFAADHKVAEEFAKGEYSSEASDRGEDPWRETHEGVVHARLGIHNPRVYASEHDMDHEAYEHEWKSGNHPSRYFSGEDEEDEASWPGAYHIHERYGNRKIPRGESDAWLSELGGRGLHPARLHWLNAHPDKWEIAARFRQHLIRQGHDGVMYGNEFERSNPGADANKGAIAFHPEQVEITQHHLADKPCLSHEEGEHAWARMPGHGQEELPFRQAAVDKRLPFMRQPAEEELGEHLEQRHRGYRMSEGSSLHAGELGQVVEGSTLRDLREGSQCDWHSSARATERAETSASKEGSRSTVARGWVPTERIFGPTYGLDHRLFDGDHLKPVVRQVLLERLDKVLEPVLSGGGTWEDGYRHGWGDFTRVYFSGSEASEWTGPEHEGNGDVDVLLGFSFDHLRDRNPEFSGKGDDEIAEEINRILRERFNESHWHPRWDGSESEWDLTGYVNGHAYEIAQIRPYAAYSLTDDEWVVRPPHLPEHSIADFPPALIAEARAVASQLRAILKLDEPSRTSQARALWRHIHDMRDDAFSPTGAGWQDPGNVIEKYIAQHPHHLLDKLKGLIFAKTAATDWAQHYDTVPGEIHRGLYAPQSHGVFSVPMSDEDIAHSLIAAHQEEQFPSDRDRHRLFGTHWTSDEGVAREFAHEHEREHLADDDHDHDEHFEAVPVVFHAQRPQSHEIEDDPRRLGWQNVDDYDTHEKEVPIRHGAPVRVTGVSWLKHTGLGPMWHRHDFREPVKLRAEDRDSPDDPNQWNASLHKEAVLPGGDTRGMLSGNPSQIAWVKVKHLMGLREYEHTRDQGTRGLLTGEHYPGSRHTPQSWDENQESVKREGIREPIIMEYNPDTHQAYLGEGNHRLAWAHAAGHEYAPVWGMRGYSGASAWKHAPHLPGEPELKPDRHDYFPSSFHPGRVLPADWLHPDSVPKTAAMTRQASSGEGYVTCEQGHRHWGAYGAAGLLIRHRGADGRHRYLLQKRSPDVDHPDTWSLFGGALHEDESSYGGARREAAEEMGALPRMKHSHQVQDDHGGWVYTTHVVDAREPFEPDRSTAQTAHETAGHGWFTADEIKDLDLHPGFARTWETVRRSRTDKTASSRYPSMPLSKIKRLYTVDWNEDDPEGATVSDVIRRKYHQVDPELERSMRERGQTAPIELRTDPWSGEVNMLGEGHHRVSIADRLGWKSMHYVVDQPELTHDPEYDAFRRSHLAAKEKPAKTKEQVNYRKGTKAEHCGNCVMIRMLPPDFESFHCTLVRGLIEEDMTCDEWYPEKGKTAAYHWSPVRNRASIEQQGLFPHHPETGFSLAEYDELPAGVYMFHRREDAEEEMPPGDIYEVNTQGLHVHPDPTWHDKALYSPAPVPAERIRRITAATAVFNREDLPPAQRSIFEDYDRPEMKGSHWSRRFLQVAKDAVPGTHVWRSESRPADVDVHDIGTVGMHWTADPDMVLKGATPPGHTTVVWQGQVDHPDQHFPRSHPMWYGIHRSLDTEAEVRFKPGAQVRLHGAYVWKRKTPEDWEHSGRGPVPGHPERNDPNWEWHPMDRPVVIRHAGQGAADYSEFGIHREAIWIAGPHYHGSPAELNPGDLIEPDKYPRSHPETAEEEGTPRKYVYFSPRRQYVADHYGPNVYEVEPTGNYARDPEYNYQRMLRSRHPLRVVRKVSENWGWGLHEAAVRTVPSRDGPDGVSTSMMVAIVPPGDVLDHLQEIMKPLKHEAEPRAKMHVTLLYLGKEDDHPAAHLEKLPDLVRQWAKTQRPFRAVTQGAGTFTDDGNHVLHALVDIRGGHEIHGSLVDFLKGHGLSAIPQDHGWIPHITLAYSPNPVRFMPKVDKMTWSVKEVWFCRGGRWESIALGRSA